MMTTLDTQPQAPSRTLQQQFDALARANEIRSHRAAFKVQLRVMGKAEARAAVAGEIVSPGPLMGSMRVFGLLLATPSIGRTKANKILVRCRVSPSKTLAGMTMRQRLELAGELRADIVEVVA